MPKAEVGTTKFLNNKLKSKGLQRLRWYCQLCERQMRDENGFKCHVQSESHVRQMLIVGENSSSYIKKYSDQFKHDFLQLLRTSHGEKKVNINHFYQEYIRDKEHIHMNATQWQSLTEFGKFLGRESICRVEEGDKGLEVAWIDSSPEALRRQDAIRKKERQDKGDEEREQKLIAEQVDRAAREVETKASLDLNDESRVLQRQDSGPIKLNFVSKPLSFAASSTPRASAPHDQDEIAGDSSYSSTSTPSDNGTSAAKASVPETVGMKFGGSKPRNVFGSMSKKNAFSGVKSAPKAPPQKPMSEAERIMKAEIERKRAHEAKSFEAPVTKRMRV